MKVIRINHLTDYVNYAKKVRALDFFCNNRHEFLELEKNPKYKINPVLSCFLEQFTAEDILRLRKKEEQVRINQVYEDYFNERENTSFPQFKETLDQRSKLIYVEHLFRPILPGMDIAMIDLLKFHKPYLIELFHKHKLLFSQDLFQLYVQNRNELKEHSTRWYVDAYREIAARNREIERWEDYFRQLEKENRTVLIHDPITKIDQMMNESLSQLFVHAFHIFKMVLGENRILVSNKVKAFFVETMPPRYIAAQLTEQDIAVRWQSFSERRSFINCAEPLLKKTRRGRVEWVKIREQRSPARIEYRFVTKDVDHTYMFNVYANKKEDDRWYCSYELVQDGVRDTEFPALHQKLFLLVKDCAKETEKKTFEVTRRKKKECEIKDVLQNTLLVRTHIFRCRYDDHEVEDVLGRFSVLLPDGTIQTELAETAYCPVCGCFFIHEYEYERLAAKGVLLCQVLENDTYRSDRFSDYSSMKAESLLMQNGYTVKSQNALTEAQRRCILKNIIETGVLSKAAVISYLQLFIKQRENLPSCERAVGKWYEDLEYVKQLDIMTI